MDILASCLAGAIAELGKCFCGSAYSKIENLAKFPSNLENLRREMANLIILRTSVQVIIAEAKRDGHELPNRARVNEWLQQVEQLDTEVGLFVVASTMNNNGETLSKYCPSCCFGCKPRLEVRTKLKHVKQLIDEGSSLKQTAAAELELRKQEVPKVQSIPGPSVQSKCLDSVLESLNREDVNRIGVWGMGGVGKTALVRTLNNTPSFIQPFSRVIWVTVSKQFDMKRVQIAIAERLGLDTTKEESMEITAHRIFQRLQLEVKLLLILDDVWEAVDLDHLGVPQPDDHPGWKLLLTSRSLDVCRRMRIDEGIKVEVLDDEESWKLFTQNAEKVVNLENIEPVAKQVARECGGLPLLIKIVGASMRGKEMVQLWEDALSEMKRSPVPNINGIHDEVYKLLKWSYDALEGMTIKSCFLFCALYPEDFLIDVKELVQCWLAEGLIDEQRSYEESTNRGIALIENLKDSCLLERCDFGASTVRMHDVVRDLASWISSSSSSEDGCKAFVRSGLGLTNFPEIETPDSVKRVSFMHNGTRNLPESVVQCPEVSTLLLQGNYLLEIVPEGFLMAFKSLKVLNLSGSGIKKLPQSLLQLRELRALLLRECAKLEELPPLGGFTKLQVLDCHQASTMKELPQGMEELSNLRALDISHTDALRRIQPGIFSKLSSLEFLDMSRGAEELSLTRFAELACLKCLTALYTHLDISGLASGSFKWIERLKRFHFIIGPRNYETDYFFRTYTEKRVTVVTLSLSGKYFGWLLNNVSSLIFDCCEELEKFPESLGRNVCYNALRLLTIAEYNGQFLSSNAGCCQMPNLERLELRIVHHLESISQLASTLGLEFSKLRKIRVFFCEKLKYLFSVGSSVSALEHLVSITLHGCEELEELFAYGSSSANPLPHPIVFNLRRVDLRGLPKLEHLSRENESWNCLEELTVLGCEKVRKLPMTAESAKTIKQIVGEPEWWSRLEWNDQNTTFLEQFYVATNRVSGTKYVTSNICFREMNRIQGLISSWAGTDNEFFRSMAQKMRKKFDKYCSIEKINPLLIIAVILDPCYKLKYVKFSLAKYYPTCDQKEVLDGYKSLMDRLYGHYSPVVVGKNVNKFQSGKNAQMEDIYSDMDVNQHTREWQQFLKLEESLNMKSEWERYLGEDVEASTPDFDILAWWKLKSPTYPVLSLMARDILAIPISTVASESAFNTGGRVLDSFRSSLTPRVVECLLCTQDWLRSPSTQICVEEQLEELENVESSLAEAIATLTLASQTSSAKEC